jgi:hypothetical protein
MVWFSERRSYVGGKSFIDKISKTFLNILKEKAIWDHEHQQTKSRWIHENQYHDQVEFIPGIPRWFYIRKSLIFTILKFFKEIYMVISIYSEKCIIIQPPFFIQNKTFENY